MAGTEQRVAISDNLTLDFAGLFSQPTTEKQSSKMTVETLLTSEQYKTITEPQKPLKRLTEGLEGQQAKQLYLESQREQEDHQRSLEVYKTYQENIKRSGQLQTEILKGIKAGEDIYSLFLKAVNAISLMTSNNLFYTQLEGDIRAIYGQGLLDPLPLQIELQETQERLTRLREAEQRELDGDSKDRIKRAVKAHEAKMTDLESLIQRERTIV